MSLPLWYNSKETDTISGIYCSWMIGLTKLHSITDEYMSGNSELGNSPAILSLNHVHLV